MSLITDSEEYLELTLEDPDYWGWSITLINLASESQEITGQARNINMLFDIESGTEIQSEQASVTVRLSTLTIGEPVKGWKGTVKDTAGTAFPFHVVQAMPDRTLGLIVLKLGALE